MDKLITAQPTPDQEERTEGARPIPPQPIVLGPDDKAAFPPAPTGFDLPRDDVPHGTVREAEYPSATVGTMRRMLIYTPPGYSEEQRYPVLFLLHGIAGNEWEWKACAPPDIILDNLYAQERAVPMIVVMPNGRAQADDRPVGNVFTHAPAFGTFENDLLNDIIPFLEANYALKRGPENRALAGLSMGGGQALNFGLGHLDTFAWIGGFSSAPNTRSGEELLAVSHLAQHKLNLLWLSCGDQDGLFVVSQRTHRYLAENQIPHIWHVQPGGHDFPLWKQDLYHFAQLIFRQ